MKRTLLHLCNLLFYFPTVVFMFLYLAFKPDEMNTFFIGVEAVLNIIGKDKGKPKP